MSNAKFLVVSACKVNGNGYQTRSGRRPGASKKFLDVGIIASPTSAGAISMLTIPTQGVGVSQRTGDVIFIEEAFLNYNVYAINTDVVSQCRVIIFQWHINSQFVVPLPNEVLQTANIFSMYNFQTSSQYSILYDVVHFLSANPSITSISSLLRKTASVTWKARRWFSEPTTRRRSSRSACAHTRL